MELRPYQKDVLIKTWQAGVENLNARSKVLEADSGEITLDPDQEFINNTGVMLQMPTGSGKTVVGIFLLKLMEKQAPNAINAWLTHRAELRSQSSGRIVEAGMRVSIMNDYKSADRMWYPGCINVVSPQLRSFPRDIANPGLLIVDEAHHTLAKTWDRIISMWIDAGGMVVGLTATPWRLSKTQGFESHYRTLICGPTVEWLQENNYLATPRVITPLDALLDRKRAKLDSTGDYNQKQNAQMVMSMLAQDKAIDHWGKFTEDMDDCRTLWFLPDKESARLLEEKLEEPSGLLLGETPQAERDKMLDDLKEYNITHLVSCEVIGEGVDLPDIPIIASLRMSKSLSVWLQQCGRGSRPKGVAGEEGGIYYVLDYAGNSHELGTPDSPHEWSLKPRGKVRPGEMPYATCYQLECLAEGEVLHPSHRKCLGCKNEMYSVCSSCGQSRRWTQFMKSPPNLRRNKEVSFFDKCTKCREFDEAERRLRVREEAAKRRENQEKVLSDRLQYLDNRAKSGFGTPGYKVKNVMDVKDVIQPYSPKNYSRNKKESIDELEINGDGSRVVEFLKSLSADELNELKEALGARHG